MSHTPEPWESVTPCHGECCWRLQSATGDEYGHKEEISSPEMSEANARRIVAAVNACAGIRTEALERRAHLLKAYDDDLATVIKQRDKLLAALTEIAELDILKYHHAYAIAKGAIEELDSEK